MWGGGAGGLTNRGAACARRSERQRRVEKKASKQGERAGACCCLPGRLWRRTSPQTLGGRGGGLRPGPPPAPAASSAGQTGRWPCGWGSLGRWVGARGGGGGGSACARLCEHRAEGPAGLHACTQRLQHPVNTRPPLLPSSPAHAMRTASSTPPALSCSNTYSVSREPGWEEGLGLMHLRAWQAMRGE